MVYVFLADGFEEIEAAAPIDILRRAGLDVITVKVGGNDKKVKGSHDIQVIADMHESEIGSDGLEMIVLPGGGAGVENLYESGNVQWYIGHCTMHQIPIGAICAAPSIPARLGYLKGVRATAYPSFRHYLTENGAILEEKQKVVTDGIFTTAATAGVSTEFGLELVRVLKGPEKAKEIGEQILFY